MKFPVKILKNFLFILLFLTIILFYTKTAFAVEDPLSVPNNKFGIHILFPEELDKAADLINSNGGDWGYVTIPIQANDRNLVKWQTFMDKARELHIIPIIRLATVPYYFDTNVWEKPTYDDVLDFANFLDSLNWPTKNRYVVIFNEPNRNAEWGGKADSSEYALVLSYSVEVFKTLNPDFYIISAGLDNGADTNNESINEYQFIREMSYFLPGVFDKIDGLGSHSYPNPGFSQAPWIKSPKSISSFLYEGQLITQMSGKNLPVFITETGWSKKALSETTIASYYQQAFSGFWSDNNIVTVTPFLLEANTNPYAQFSFLNSNQTPNKQYQAIKEIRKINGKPTLTQINKTSSRIDNKKVLFQINFNFKEENFLDVSTKIKTLKTFLKWLLRI